MSGCHRKALLAACVGWILTLGAMAGITDQQAQRVDTLLSRLTQEEKISLLAGDGYDGMSTVAIPRLGIPKLVMADGPQGIRAHGKACSFPSGIALAATWDPDLAFRYGQAIALEARARGIHIQLGPGANIARTPLNGRNFEYYGEDPFLAGVMAASWIKGLQGEGVAATVKHFVGNDTEWRRMEIETLIDEQTLREIYLRPFERAVREGGAWAVMSAYNKVNGFPSTSHQDLQEKILKKEWGFPGTVMSDWWATDSVESLAKGLDLEMPMSYRVTPSSVHEALSSGKLTQARIDDAVRRLLTMMVSMGFLDRDQTRKDLPLDSPANAALALEVATQSIVLLKNEGSLLPLNPATIKRIVVYGPNAQDTPAVGGGSGGVEPFHKVSFLEGIRRALPADAEVFYAPLPRRKPFDLADFLDFGAPSQPLAQITEIRKITSIHQPSMDRVTTSPVHGIEISWSKYLPPDEVPRGHEARICWDAVIESARGGTFELVSEGHPEIRLGDREVGNPESYVITLTPGQKIPLRVVANEVGRGTGRVSVTIRPVPKEATGVFPARTADAAVVCVGLNPDVEGEGYDRGFTLPIEQQRLIEQVSAANRHTIVVLSGGGAVEMQSWIAKVPSVLQTWYLGQSAGTALASLLFGERSPSGHLPCTFDRSIEENPSSADYPGTFVQGKEWPVVDYKEGLFCGYRGYDRSGKDPLFPFGFGLTYTTFEMGEMSAIQGPQRIDVSVQVTNTGDKAGTTVVQIYAGLPGEGYPRPVRELKGFRKIELQPGERAVALISLDYKEFNCWENATHRWVPPKGPIRIEAGFSSRDIRQVAEIPHLDVTEMSRNPEKSPLPMPEKDP